MLSYVVLWELYNFDCSRNKVLMNNLSTFYYLYTQKQTKSTQGNNIFLTSFTPAAAAADNAIFYKVAYFFIKKIKKLIPVPL